MRRYNFGLLLIIPVAIVVAPGLLAFAGKTDPVEAQLTSPMVARGALEATRWSSNGNKAIGCTITAAVNAADVDSASVTCTATFANGSQLQCDSSKAALVAAAAGINFTSLVQFEVDSTTTKCRMIIVENSSTHSEVPK